MEITSRVLGNSLLISMPFDLKDAFKEMFKTANWNAFHKSWEVSNSKINFNKLERFKEQSTAAIAALIELENIEATDAEIEEMEKKLAKIESRTKHAIAVKANYQERINKLAEIKAIIEVANPSMLKAQREAEAAKEIVGKTIKAQVDKYGINTLISRLIYISKQYSNSANRSKFYAAQRELTDAHGKIYGCTGINLKALTALCSVDYKKTTPQGLFLEARGLLTEYSISEPALVKEEEIQE